LKFYLQDINIFCWNFNFFFGGGGCVIFIFLYFPLNYLAVWA